MRAFLKDLTLKESCYKCPFKYPEGSRADVSIGDFWGIESLAPELDNNIGTTVVICRTDIGEEICSNLDMQGCFVLDDIAKYNPAVIKSVSPHPDRNSFLDEFDNLPYKTLQKTVGRTKKEIIKTKYALTIYEIRVFISKLTRRFIRYRGNIMALRGNGNKKKILFVNGDLSVGGTERALINIINAIDPERYSVDLLLYQPGRDLASNLTENVKIIFKDTTGSYGPIFGAVAGNMIKGKWFDALLRIANTLPSYVGKIVLKSLRKSFGLEKQYDVAIAFRPGFAEDIVLNGVKASRKITWWHTGDTPKHLNKKKLRQNWSKFNSVVTVSDGIAELLKRNVSEAVDKTEVIYNMIDPKEISIKAEMDNPYNCDNGVLKIVTVSRLSVEKNLERIIDIAKELRSRGIEFRWIILGEGPLYDSLNRLIQANSLEDYVDLHGATLNPYVWMRHADIMVHPSLVESFGLVLIEAMSLGTPCVAAKSLGAIDIINSANGILVDDDPIAYADAIMRYHRNPDMVKKMASSCSASIERFASKKVIEQFYKIVNQ